MATLLIIDDSPQQRASLRDALVEAELFDRILEAEDGIQGLKLMVSEDIDLVVCDLEMPGLEGDKLISMSTSAGSRPVPFLVLTAVEDANRRARLFRQGARDVITKPFHPLDMIARIELHLELMRLQAELMDKNKLLERISTTDPLSGLPNRRHLNKVLDREFRRAQRSGSALSAVMIDIDHFKAVNDAHGHTSGDAVIRAVGKALTERLRVTDEGGRFGGEEFLLLLGGDARGAEVLAERCRAEVERLEVEAEDGQLISVTVSLGVASYQDTMANPRALVSAADRALYVAKTAGRNQVAVDRDSLEDDADH
ncbi:MAG: diguanylate cyclase [bacterium]|nr:diguanylate cyclase [bacterium]